MIVRFTVSACAVLTVAACAVVHHPVVAPALSQNRTLNWHATDPQPSDGRTRFAMADIDTSATKTLAAYEPARDEYPSVGGDILRGVPRTPLIDLQPVRPATTDTTHLREPSTSTATTATTTHRRHIRRHRHR
jgi:hypothetical protein